MQFFNLKALLDATLTILTTIEAIAVDVWESIPVGARNLQVACPSWKRVPPTETIKEQKIACHRTVNAVLKFTTIAGLKTMVLPCSRRGVLPDSQQRSEIHGKLPV